MSYYPGQQGQQYPPPPAGQAYQAPAYPGHHPSQQYPPPPQQGYPAPPPQQGYPPPPSPQQGYPPQGNAPQGNAPQGNPPPGPVPAPQAAPSGTGMMAIRDHGTFAGGSYSITHRDTNTVLTVDLAPGGTVKSQPGAMIHMSGTVQLGGKVKFSLGKLFTGGDMAESVYTGHGRVALGPTLFGDIITLPVDGAAPGQWKMGRDAFLACTADVRKETKAQGFGKALFSGEDMFVYNIVGNGLMWIKSFGAVDRIDLRPAEQHIVDNGHLVAWSCDYKIEKAGGGLMTSLKTGEGLVCRFTGPGSIYIQSRNGQAFEEYIRSVAQVNNN